MKKRTVSLRMSDSDFNFLEEGKSLKESRTDFLIKSMKTARAMEVLRDVYSGQKIVEALIYLERGNFKEFMSVSYTIADINLLKMLDKICSETFSDEQLNIYRNSVKFRRGVVL